MLQIVVALHISARFAGRDESGWDISLSEAGMVKCVNGHTICEDDMIDTDRESMIKTILEAEYNEYTEVELSGLEVDELKDNFHGKSKIRR